MRIASGTLDDVRDAIDVAAAAAAASARRAATTRCMTRVAMRARASCRDAMRCARAKGGGFVRAIARGAL